MTKPKMEITVENVRKLRGVIGGMAVLLKQIPNIAVVLPGSKTVSNTHDELQNLLEVLDAVPGFRRIDAKEFCAMIADSDGTIENATDEGE